MIYELCAIVLTLATTAFLVYATLALIDLRKTLKQTQHTLRKVEPISSDFALLIQNVNTQLVTLDPLVKSAGDIGHALHDVKKKVTRLKEKDENFWEERATKFLELGLLAANVWKQIKNRR